MTRELMETLGATPGVLPYLDIPLQHASRMVLSRMGRGGSGDSFSRILAELRQRAPGISVRSTFITGFPGETEAEFAELLRFVEEAEFDHIGVFTYSHESGAPSFGMKDDVPEDLKRDRRQVLLDLQEEIAGRPYRELTGSEVEVLVEGDGPEPGTLVGRAAFQAPEVDGNVVFRCSQGTAGPFTRVLVEEAWPYALYGRDATSPVSPGRRPLPVVS